MKKISILKFLKRSKKFNSIAYIKVKTMEDVMSGTLIILVSYVFY